MRPNLWNRGAAPPCKSLPQIPGLTNRAARNSYGRQRFQLRNRQVRKIKLRRCIGNQAVCRLLKNPLRGHPVKDQFRAVNVAGLSLPQ